MMKFTITREQLAEGVGAVSTVVPSKTTLPVLANLLIETTRDGIRISGTDLDMAISMVVPASVDQEGAVTLPSRTLVELVRELPSAGIRFTTQGEQRVNIECGRSKFKLLGLPREEYPAFPHISFANASRTTAGDLQKLIQHVAFAASSEENRPILNGVLWQLTPERMRMVATNGHRLAKMEVPVSGSSLSGDLIIPPKALDQIRKLFRNDEEIEIDRSENNLGFRSATTQVYTRLIDGPYPPYEQVIPRENDKAATVDKASLSAAIRRMSIVASDQTHRIRMAFADGSCKLSVTTPDLGEAQEEINLVYEGEPLEIGFNATYLLEVLKQMPTDEIRISLKAPERAAMVEPVGWDDPASYLALVMPLRLID